MHLRRMADYTSLNQLAKRVGVTHRTVSKWLRDKRFPVQREAPWTEDDAREIEMWRRAVLQPNRADPAYQGRVQTEPPAEEQDKDYWLMRKYRAQALEQEGKLLDTDAVMRAWTQTVGDIRDQLLLMPPAVQGLLNLSDDQTRQLDEYLKRTLDGVADRMGNLADDARSVPSGGEGDTTAEADDAVGVGSDASVHAEVDDGQPRPVEE